MDKVILQEIYDADHIESTDNGNRKSKKGSVGKKSASVEFLEPVKFNSRYSSKVIIK